MWISCKERLPSFDEEVLVYVEMQDDSFTISTAWLRNKESYRWPSDLNEDGWEMPAKWSCHCCFYGSRTEVTHWQPLPAPPVIPEDESEDESENLLTEITVPPEVPPTC